MEQLPHPSLRSPRDQQQQQDLDEFLAIPDEGYDCPEGTAAFDSIVLPERITYAN